MDPDELVTITVNPKAAVLLVLLAVVVLALLVAAALWWLSRQAGVRRAAYRRMQRERDLLQHAIHDIETKTDAYRDLESVLATEIRFTIRQLNTQRMDLPQ